jgi:hypothetical protein
VNVICPHCNSRLELTALAEDAAARQLFGLLKDCGPAGSAVITYLGLFKPPKQALRWARALKLAEEVMVLLTAVGGTLDELTAACLRTVAALDERRKGSDWQPLTSHRYLARVLDAVITERDWSAGPAGPSTSGNRAARSKRSEALQVLDED